ncbi:PIG-L deacetylase family protein [Actinacidiphila rubida]|uniref:PIG-L deacetylase family protein n=1 Tax=Actinacidiphila rubida TaxID=310780 RepID=UPI0009426CB4
MGTGPSEPQHTPGLPGSSNHQASQTGGTLARCAASGARTVVVVCTDGSRGHGPDDAPGVPRADRAAQIAARRSRELGRARAALGITDRVELGYPDSGTSPSAADSDVFSSRPGEPVIRRLEVLMGQYEPDVVVTYPPNGLTFHPDHTRVRQMRTTCCEYSGSREAIRLSRNIFELSRPGQAAGVKMIFSSEGSTLMKKSPPRAYSGGCQSIKRGQS